jgi:hypothetical protein
VAASVEADLRVIPNGVIRVCRQPEQCSDGRNSADLAAGRQCRELRLGQQSNIACAEDVARLAQVEVIRGVEDDDRTASLVRRNGNDLGEGPGIDSFGRGGGAGREGPVVLVDLVLDALSGEPVEKGSVRSVERDLSVHRL